MKWTKWLSPFYVFVIWVNERKFVMEHDYSCAAQALLAKFSVVLEKQRWQWETRENRRMQEQANAPCAYTRKSIAVTPFFVFSRNSINNSNQIATISRAGGLPRPRPIVKSYVGGKSSTTDDWTRQKKKESFLSATIHWKKTTLIRMH